MTGSTAAFDRLRRHSAALSIAITLIAFPAHTQDTDYSLLWLQGDYRGALEAIEERLERYSNFMPPHLAEDYGEILFQVGNVDQAIAVYQSLLDRYQEPQYAATLAEYYRYRGRMEDYQATLVRGQAIANRGLQYGADQDEFLGIARIDRMTGKDPKDILNTRFKVLNEQRPRFVDAYVAAGDLAYAAHGYKVSADYYQQALDLAPNNQAALAGLAECYYESNDPRLEEEALPALFELNPNHPRGLAIEVRDHLEGADAGAALEIIEARLAVNPNDLLFLGFKAAAHYLEDDYRGLESAQEQALAFNPHCSDVYRIPGEIAMRQYRFREAEQFLQEAIMRDPEDYAALGELGFAVLRQGRNEEGRGMLEAVSAADPYNVQVFNMLEVLDSVDSFAEIERGPFVVHLPEYEAVLIGDTTLELLDEAYTLYTEKYDVDLELPIYVELFEDHDEFMVRSIGLPGNAGHLGICFGQLLTLDSPRARRPGSTNFESVVWHEFVHIITLQKTNNRMPRWLSEGISVYEETVRDKAWGQRMEPTFKAIAVTDGWPTMDDLADYFLQPKSGRHLMYGYFAAGEFAKFYIETYGQDAMNNALDAIGGGGRCAPALAAAADLEEDGLNKAFAAYMEDRCKGYEALPEVPEMPELEEGQEAPMVAQPQMPWHQLSSPFTDAMMRGAEALSEDRLEEALAAYEEAHGLYPEFVNPDAPLYRIAMIHQDMGNEEKYIETLERILKWDNTAFDAALELGEHYAALGQHEDVLRVTDVCFAINPFQLSTRQLMLDSYRALGKLDSALLSLDHLAYLDSNRRTEYLLTRGQLLADAGRLDAAKRETIALLEELPHYRDAQELLLRIVDPPLEPADETPDEAGDGEPPEAEVEAAPPAEEAAHAVE